MKRQISVIRRGSLTDNLVFNGATFADCKVVSIALVFDGQSKVLLKVPCEEEASLGTAFIQVSLCLRYCGPPIEGKVHVLLRCICVDE